MATDWLDVDYADPDRPPAAQAPAGWEDDIEAVRATADEIIDVETATGGLLAARRGLTTLYWGAEMIRADLDTEADAHADYARIRAEITCDPAHRLQAAGAWLATVRAEQRQAMTYLADIVEQVVPGQVPEATAARLAGVDRMTIRKMLGKR